MSQSSPPAGPLIGDPTTVTPPASVPVAFLAAGAVGLFGFGFVTWFAADKLVTAPNHPAVVAAVHLGVLAFLTTAVLGAVHQFGPVVGRRPLRSIATARLTMVTVVIAGWLLPNGFAHGPEWMVVAGALLGSVAVITAAWNLSAPLSARDGGIPVVGLRISLAYLVLTVAFGVVYVLNRRAGWFPLLPNRVLAHAHLGLFGWLGLTYLSVSEKLWPMFLLSHRPTDLAGKVAVSAVGSGTLPLALGLLLALPALAWVGGALVLLGLMAHVVSLVGSVRHRRRPLELLHAYLFSSTVFLLAGIGFGAAAAIADVDPSTRSMLVAAEVGSLIAWLGLAVVGHSHKIVPFISYTALRAKGVRMHRSGRPLLFGDLYHKGTAWLTLAMMLPGFGAVVVGTLARSTEVIAVGGGLVGTAAIAAVANLFVGTRRASAVPAEKTSSQKPTRSRSDHEPTANRSDP